MTGHFNTKQFTTRYLAWDEENRLMGVADNNQVSFYLYDAAGERTVKFTGHNQWVDVNGIPQGYAGADKLTLYASPYLVATSGQYTKHYYAGEQRILSKIGGGGLGNYNNKGGIVSSNSFRAKTIHVENLVRFTGNVLQLTTLSVKPKYSAPCNQEGMLVDLCDYRNIAHEENDRYFYHPDHLGSSSWITGTDGTPVQHLSYLPFGEEFVDQKTSNWSAAHKFSGKEKDEETGYNYFHARYYDPNTSIFLSVDPLSDKYPSLSSYAYCANNPIMLIDPDGRKIWVIGEDRNHTSYNGKESTSKDNFTNKAIGSMNDVAAESPEAKALLQDLIDSPYDYYIQSGTESNFDANNGMFSRTEGESAIFYQGGGTITWNPNGADIPVIGTDIYSPKLEKNGNMDLFHELGHARDASKGTLRTDNNKWRGVSHAEWSATHTENLIRCETNQPLRTHYGINIHNSKTTFDGGLLQYQGKNIKNKYNDHIYKCR